jgi:hypothetical protein
MVVTIEKSMNGKNRSHGLRFRHSAALAAAGSGSVAGCTRSIADREG